MTETSKEPGFVDQDAPAPEAQGDFVVSPFERKLGSLFKGFQDDSATLSDVIYRPADPERTKYVDAKLGESNALYKSLAKLKHDGPDSVRVMSPGVHYHPLDFAACTRMKTVSPHHSSCIDSLVDMAIGNGFEDAETQEVLDSMTEYGITAELDRMCQSLFATGQGYLETVRSRVGDNNSPVQRIVAQPSTHMSRVQHGPKLHEQHFIYTPYSYAVRDGYGSSTLFDSSTDLNVAAFAQFGRVSELLGILPTATLGTSLAPVSFRDVGEVIDFKLPTDMWEHYGAPRWVGANAYMELSRQQLQRTYTYMHNRGAPDTLTMLWGVRLTEDQKMAMKGMLNANTGSNFGKSVLLTFPFSAQQSGKAQVERFTDQIDGDTFQEIHDVCALATCSAHRVSPVLAGISTSRVMGAAAEQTQAMVIMQLLAVNKIQELIQTRLRKTLGGPQGIRRLRGKDFKLKKVTEVQDMAALNVMARQRQQDTSATRSTESGDAAPSLSR